MLNLQSMMNLRRILPLRVLTLLLVVALASSGFAHRILTPSEQALQNYALTFGLDASEICGGEGSDVGTSSCEACLLHAAMAPPESGNVLVQVEQSLDNVNWTPHAPGLSALHIANAHPARAPPFV